MCSHRTIPMSPALSPVGPVLSAMPCSPPEGCIGRESTSEAAPEAVRQAVGGGCRSSWGRLLSVANGIEAGTCRQGDSGWALAGRPGKGGGVPPPPLFQSIPAPQPPPPPLAPPPFCIQVSNAARGLCMWCIAMHRFGLVQKEVMPKKMKLDKTREELARKEKMLAAAEEELRKTTEKVEALEKQTEEKLAEKQKLQEDAEATENKLKRAEEVSDLSAEGSPTGRFDARLNVKRHASCSCHSTTSYKCRWMVVRSAFIVMFTCKTYCEWHTHRAQKHAGSIQPWVY